MAKVIYVDATALHKELDTSAGELWKWLHKRGLKAVNGAKRSVGVQTGALKRSIHMKHLGNATGQYLWIGSQRSHALVHHEGSKPHLITPNPPNQVLKFNRGSRVIFARQVMHPGTRPNRYLSSQLRHFIK